PNPFSTSPFAGYSILTGNLTINATQTSGTPVSVPNLMGFYGGTISVTPFNLPGNTLQYVGTAGGTENITTTSGNISAGLLQFVRQATYVVNIPGSLTVAGASTTANAAGVGLNLTARGGITFTADILLPSGNLTFTSTGAGQSGGAIT